MLASLGRFTNRNSRTVLLAAFLFALFAGLWGPGVLQEMSTSGYADPGAESERASALLEREFGRTSPDAVAVYSDPTKTVDDPEFAEAVTAAVDRLPDTRIARVQSYWTPGATDEERDALVSEDRHTTYVALNTVGDTDEERLASYEAVLGDLRADGLQVVMGGQLTSLHQLQTLATGDLASAQLIAMPILLVLLVIIFRGVVAALMPIVLGVFAVLGSMVLLRLLTGATEVSVFALQVTMLLGLGLAIDYGLFVVSRYRDELAQRGDPGEAIAATLPTAGRTVVFSGLTVIVALCGLLVFPQPASRSLGLGGITAVLFTVLAAVTVLPALLTLLGHRINALRVPWPRRARTPAKGAGGWARLAGFVMRRPVLALITAGLVLLVAAGPLLSLQPGLTNHRYLPAGNDGQEAAEILDEEFPNEGPVASTIRIAVVGEVEEAELDGYVARLANLDGAGDAEVERANGDVAQVAVGYSGDADDGANTDLVVDIRAVEPPVGATEVLVGGAGGPAVAVDSTDSTLDSLPRALLVVVVGTAILLFLAFGSLLLPLKALLVASLSLAATFGVLTWAIQDGGLASPLGFVPVGTTDIWTYGIVAIIAFGLITDYELFIVSRAREEYTATGDNTRAIATGVQRTAGIITSAALLMIVVLGTAGLTSRSLVIATLGIGLTVAIAIDATLVRAVLVPASMRLFGRLNWWLPRPLRRLHERVAGTGDGATSPPPAGLTSSTSQIRWTDAREHT
ncbi:RND superfamily putative drug exporter [Lipingzhangella halophila]|uniref:RND superfamily putative drug exporter n=1 Tax=Lipingzhangella halophila TaxID=1783352 RepID=A0A7W7W3R1_9ACTN|nr:MMPL family transporter [Lipingzhangella halophila]MBB4933046.1 RND superfamily putative drug exporter [Lipingzhangella halophila]